MTRKYLMNLRAEALKKIDEVQKWLADPELCYDLPFSMETLEGMIETNQNLVKWADEQIAKKVWRKA